jgi:hypothetical protein
MPVNSSKDRKVKAHQAKVFKTVESNPTLLDLLETATSSARKTIFIKAVIDDFKTAFVDFKSGKNLEDLFLLFTAWFGSFDESNTTYPGIYAALQHRKNYFSEHRSQKLQFLTDIGLDWTADIKASFLSNVNYPFDVIGKYSFLF